MPSWEHSKEGATEYEEGAMVKMEMRKEQCIDRR